MSTEGIKRFDRILALLNETQRAAERLLNALYDERNALRDDDSDALSSCVSRKKMHLDALEKLGHSRQAMLAADDVEDTMQGMTSYVRRNDRDGALEAVWSKVIALLSECREANNGNGIIIASQQKQKQEALRVMRGQDGTSDTETYNPDGKADTTGQYRALAEV
ncbi:MAG: flagellar protein FlgN [Pseudomonadota bacterium]